MGNNDHPIKTKTKYKYKYTSVLSLVGLTDLLVNNFSYILERVGFLNELLCRKANCIAHILRINRLLHDAIEGQMTEMKKVRRRRRRRTEFLDYLRNRKRY